MPHADPPPIHLNYLYCDSPATYASAVWHLRHAPYLIVDCEGNNLGRAGGSVTLICVGTPFAEHIFLFDVLSPLISRYDIDALLSLFNDENILKVMWDGRMDYLEILETYGVPMRGVLDLQIAEVVSRSTIRGEGEEARVRRIRNVLGFHNRHRARYDGLHAVIGLQRCWRDCGYSDATGKDPEVVSMHKDGACAMWAARPLTEQLLQYAAKDILLIGVLYPHFCRSGWIPRDPAQYSVLLAQSQRYVSAHQQQGKSANDDIFRPCGITPLDTLVEPRGHKAVCFACNRSLSMDAFELSKAIPRTNGSVAPVGRLRSTRCRLCHALVLKTGLQVDQTWVLV